MGEYAYLFYKISEIQTDEVSSTSQMISQEVRHKGLVWNSTSGLISQGMEDFKGSYELVVHIQDRCNITTSVAIVWCGPNSNKILISEPVFEAVHDKLMRSGNQGNVIDVIKLSCHSRSKEPSGTSGRHGPSFNIFRVGPHKITERSFVWDLHSSVNESYLIDGFNLGRETSVNTEDLAFDDSTNAEIIEYFCAIFPRVGISILSNSLIIEAIYGSDLSGLMVTSEEGDVRWVLEFEAQKELEGLYRVESSVYEISHENVARVWDFTTFIEKFQKIMELAVDITTDGYWSFDRLDIALFNENLLDFLAENSELSFW
jgi:hypothetical protein